LKFTNLVAINWLRDDGSRSKSGKTLNRKIHTMIVVNEPFLDHFAVWHTACIDGDSGCQAFAGHCFNSRKDLNSNSSARSLPVDVTCFSIAPVFCTEHEVWQ
jgi:hypothetical protein